MYEYGREIRHYPKAPLAGRIYAAIFGQHLLGEYVRWLYFKKVFSGFDFAGKKVLDAGCGGGYFSFYLARKFPTCSIDAIDSVPETVEENTTMAKKSGIKNVRFSAAKLEELSAKGKYDVIVCMEVLEHIHDDKKAVSNLRDALKKGGTLFIHVPREDDTTHGHVRHGYELEHLVSMAGENLSVANSGYSGGRWTQFLWRLNGFGTGNSYLKALTAPLIKPLMNLELLFRISDGDHVWVLARKD